MTYASASDGTRLYYEQAGSGTPVIFIHEFAGDYRSWEPQMRFFARYFRCIAYNARAAFPLGCTRGRRALLSGTCPG
jgi:pimeloyl-ACP methyl ester carboxylesterase